MHTRTLTIIDGELAVLKKGLVSSELSLLSQSLSVSPGFNPAEAPYLSGYEYNRYRSNVISRPTNLKPADYDQLLLLVSYWSPKRDPETQVTGFADVKVRHTGHDGKQYFRVQLATVNARAKLSVEGFRKSVSGDLVPVTYQMYWDGKELSIGGPFGENELVDNLDYGVLAQLYGKELATLEQSELNTFVYVARTLAHKALRDKNHTMALESVILALRAAYANPADMSDYTRKIRLSVHGDLHKLVAPVQEQKQVTDQTPSG